MKAVILAGGLGSRLQELTTEIPKPMVEIGGMPILWHIMKIFYHQGIDDFIICAGYKANYIKKWFIEYRNCLGDVIVERDGSYTIKSDDAEKWKVTVADTGLHTMTGGRLKAVKRYLDPDEPFYFTYGDGVANVDLNSLLSFHKSHQCLATMTVARPEGRFGSLSFEPSDRKVKTFGEKKDNVNSYVNAGFFVLSPKVLDYIESSNTTWEQEPLEQLTNQSNLHAYVHDGFWKPMDNLKDRNTLEKIWSENNPEKNWKIW